MSARQKRHGGALRGAALDIARFMVALAPNVPAYRRQLEHALAERCGALAPCGRPLEQQRAPEQGRLVP